MIKKFIKSEQSSLAEIKTLCVQIISTIEDMKQVYTDENGEMSLHQKQISKILNRIIKSSTISLADYCKIVAIKYKVSALYQVMNYKLKLN